MKKTFNRIIGSSLVLFILLGIPIVPVFAGTLTNTSFTWTSDVVSETNTLTFEYTNETAVNSVGSESVFRGNFGAVEGGAMFDFNGLDGSDATVTLNGVPATIASVFGLTVDPVSIFQITIEENVMPETPIVVTINNVINQATAGSYTVSQFGTADGGGNLVDTPANSFAFELFDPVVGPEPFVGDGAGTAEDPYQVTECFIAVESGYYALQNNITDVVGDCIVIEADDVFINGAGLTISSATDDVNRLNQAIETEGYDRISISNITLDGFYDGIYLTDSVGASAITDVTMTNMLDDGINFDGVTDTAITDVIITNAGDDGIDIKSWDNDADPIVPSENITITNAVISAIQDSGIEIEGAVDVTVIESSISDIGGDGIYVAYSTNIDISENTIDDANDDGIDFSGEDNINITITDNTITNIGDNGMELDKVEDITVTGNSVSDIGDDAIKITYATNVTVSGNTIDTAGSDGIFVADGTDVTVSDNTVNNVGSDGVDFSYNVDGNTNVTITDNTLTNIGDNGIELDEVHGAVITGNTITTAVIGIAVEVSEDIEFSDNTITPTSSTWEDELSADDDYFNYDLPFVFPFFGRNITEITINTNGSVELLEEGEDCVLCDEYGSFDVYLDSNVIFASFDDLRMDTNNTDYVAVAYDETGGFVIVEWFGSTYDDDDSEGYPIHFQVILYPNGEIQWNFNEMEWSDSGYDMFSGVYDFEESKLYIADFDINTQISYNGNFSGSQVFPVFEGDPMVFQIPETTYEFLTTDGGYPAQITGLHLNDVADSSFIGNSIRAGRWVYGLGLENVLFNDEDSGNTYYLLNGDGAWTIFDLIDTTDNGYADSGLDRPFNEETLGVAYWEGEGQDEYPATILGEEQSRSSSSSGSKRIKKEENPVLINFTDTKGHWGEEYIDKLKDKCGVTGYTDQSGVALQLFGPDKSITRAELVRMLIGCSQIQVPAVAELPFNDVLLDSWFAPYISYAKKLNWIEGYSDGSFKPNTNINRAEAIKIILKSHFDSDEIKGDELSFTDTIAGEWYYDFLSFAFKDGFIAGYNDPQGLPTGLFGPANNLTRSEAAKIIVNAMKL